MSNHKKLTMTTLGRNEYNRLMAEQKRRAQGIQPRQFTGLSLNRMTRLEYDRQLRRLKRTQLTATVTRSMMDATTVTTKRPPYEATQNHGLLL